jgi:enoyl-CoA hydratase/carnithine racemase
VKAKGILETYMIEMMNSDNTKTPAQEPVLSERDGPILTVTLNRPEVRNALDVELMASLKALWRDADALRGVRCIIVTGAGAGFCSGADMSLLETDRSDAADTVAEELAFLPGPVVERPVIVAVNGVCAGGGLHFVADGDIVLASESASFVDPHVSVGQVTALEPLTLRLQMRPDLLARMALVGRRERLSAARAREAGLVSEVVAPDQLLPRARELAGWIAENSPAAVRRSRRVLRGLEERLIADSLEPGWAELRAHWTHPDCKEGPQAFIERRDPVWSDA